MSLDANESDKPTLLLVEDNPDLRDYFREFLGEHFEIIVAANGEEALDVLQKRSVGLVITDLMMPVMDGFEFIQGIKSRKDLEDIPVMVVSARDSQEDRYRIMHLGVNNILVKPFDRDELILMAKNMIKEKGGSISMQHLVNNVEEHHKTQLEMLNRVILRNIDNHGLTIAVLAAELNQSERSFFRMVKKVTGMSPLEYIKEVKMQFAMDLIKRKQTTSVKELSARVGIKSSAEFTKQFKKRFDVKPSELINS